MKINNTEFSDTKITNSLLLIEESFNYTSVDSFTVDNDTHKITSLICLNRDNTLPQNGEISQFFNISDNRLHMKNRVLLAEALNVPLFLLSINPQNISLNFFSLRQIKRHPLDNEKFSIKTVRVGNSNELTQILFNLRGGGQSNPKPLIYNSLINNSKVISDIKSSLGGNLDGFTIKNDAISFVEFTKIGEKVEDPNGDKTLNYNPIVFMKSDYRRWAYLELIKNQVKQTYPNSTLDIIVWNKNENFLKKIIDVSFTGPISENLKFIFEPSKVEIKTPNDLSATPSKFLK